MYLKTVSDFKRIYEFNNYKDHISLENYNQLLQLAEKLHAENQWLYEKLNIISETIEDGRNEVNRF
jgi:hypothetical protein